MRISDWSSDVCSSDLEAQVDLINVEDKAKRTQEAAKLGAHIIGVHTGLDAQAAGGTPFADLGLVAGLNLGVKVSVAGGVKAATVKQVKDAGADIIVAGAAIYGAADPRSEEHTSELQSLMRISYAVFCLKKKNR